MCGRARRSAIGGCAWVCGNGRGSKRSKRQPRVCRRGRLRRCASRGRPDAPQRAAYTRVCGWAWRLGHSHRFEAAQTDTFDLVVQPEIGELRSVRVGHDNKGFSPGWCGPVPTGPGGVQHTMQHGTRHARHSME
jgi:hypothetical protein